MRAVLLLGVLAAGTAHAQAPGEVQPLPAPEQPSVMDRRFSVSASLGPLGLKPKDSDRDSVTFTMFELAGHFRIRSWIDLGLSLHGAGAAKGDLSAAGIYIDARYRFLAEQPWNIWALLSLGVASVAEKEDAEDKADTGRGSMRLGVGVERRFRAWAIHAELRLVGIGENKDFEPAAITPDNEMSKAELSGGSLTFGGSFYF